VTVVAAALLLPTPEGFANLAGMLVGKKIKAIKSTAPLAAPMVRGVASYVDAGGNVKFVAVTDVAFIGVIGAALAMIPLPMVTEAIRTGKPSEALVENAYEVLNVAASLFNEVEGTTTHVKVAKLLVGPLEPELAKRLLKPAARLDMVVSVPGYPDAKLAFVALN
jgi:hypothetical protein